VRQLPFSEAWERAAFQIVLGIFIVGELAGRVRSRRNRGGGVADWSLLVVVVSIGAGMAAGFAFASDVPAAAVTQARRPLFLAGLTLMCAGIALRQWAIATLGDFFTVDVRVRPGQTVVATGPYRWVRHPSYTGLIATFVGIGLALGNWAALAALAVVPTMGLVVRIFVEERLLLSRLGEPYRGFAATRARLFPGLW